MMSSEWVDPHEIQGYCVICDRPIMIDDWRGIVPAGMVCEHCADTTEYEEDE
jgi:hypothetical protein